MASFRSRRVHNGHCRTRMDWLSWNMRLVACFDEKSSWHAWLSCVIPTDPYFGKRFSQHPCSLSALRITSSGMGRRKQAHGQFENTTSATISVASALSAELLWNHFGRLSCRDLCWCTPPWDGAYRRYSDSTDTALWGSTTPFACALIFTGSLRRWLCGMITASAACVGNGGVGWSSLFKNCQKLMQTMGKTCKAEQCRL